MDKVNKLQNRKLFRYDKKFEKLLLIFYYISIIISSILFPLIFSDIFINKIEPKYLVDSNATLILAIIVLVQSSVYIIIKRKKLIIGLIKYKNINRFKDKWDAQFFMLRKILLYFHLIFTPIMILLTTWHAIVELQIIYEWNFQTISGLFFWISIIILFITGIIPIINWKVWKKYHIKDIHILLSILFVLGFILHLASS